MNRKNFFVMLTILLLLSLLTTPLAVPASPQEYPVPREKAVIFETDTSYTVFDSANPYIPHGTQWGSGWHQVVEEWDWYMNYATGEVILWRITGWDYSADYKTFTLHVREGVTWNDGEPYSAHDIVFTINMLKADPTLFGGSYYDEWVESAEATDDYTAVIHLKKPNPRFHNNYRMWGGTQGQIKAEHVWKGKDPKAFKDWPPVETGPYKLYDVYPALNMFIWERRDDYWAKEVFNKFPKPKYVIGRKAPPPDIDLADFVNGMVDAPLPHVFSWEMIKSAKALTPYVTTAPFMDPCPLGPAGINTDVYPLNLREVRWAIAYCLNREKLSELYPMAEYAPVCKYPWPIPAYGVFDKYVPMVEKALTRIEDEFGFTFEYNPAKAEEILDGLGFAKGPDGIRVTSNGTRLSWEILSRPVTVVQEYYISLDLADELKKIGIDASVRTVDPAMWGDITDIGDYDIAGGTLCAGWITGDMVDTLDLLHSKRYVPIGETPVWGQGYHGSNPRYKNPELDAIVDELWTIGPDTARAAELYEEGIYIMVRDLLGIPAVEKTFVQTFNSQYWTNWPSEENMYHTPYIWWPEWMFVLFEIEPVEAPPIITYVGVYLLEDVAAFTGVDEKTYGPFVAGSFAMIPEDDAESLVADKKASYTAPVPPELEEIAEAVTRIESAEAALKTAVDDLDSSVADVSEDVSATLERFETLAGQVTTLTMVAVVEGIAIVVLAVLAVLLRRKPT